MESIEDIKKEMLYWYALELTNDQVQEIINNVTIDGGIDTVDREKIGDYISQKLTGKEWPCNGDSDEYKKQFYNDFKINAEKLGYKFIGEF